MNSHLPKGVTNVVFAYAFPNMFPRPWMLKNLPQIGKKYTIGFHPRSAASSYPDYFEKFKELAEKEDTIAIGDFNAQLHWWLLS